MKNSFGGVPHIIRASSRTSGFLSVNEWKTALMALSDQNFFELLRSVFGNIKTPFNKQRLMDDLYALLSREDIRQTIAGYLDERDRLVIAATALLQSPAPGELEVFFSGGLSYGELHALLRNLEERLILYRFEDNAGWHLSLNPALQSTLAPIAADTGPLFPSSPVKAGETGSSAVAGTVYASDNRAMALLFAFIEEEKIFFKAEGARKKIQEDAKRFFPNFDLELIVPILARLGLFHREEESFVPNKNRINDFSLLTPEERQEYWTAALYLFLNENLGGIKAASTAWESFNYSRLRETALFIHDFMSLVDPQRRYPKITLRRYACLLAREFSGKEIWGRRLFGDSPELRIEPFLETLEKCGLISAMDGFYKGVSAGAAKEESPDTPDKKSKRKKKANAVIAMDSPVSFILYPDISLEDALLLASFCLIKDGGGFEITRSSVIRFFDQGFGSDDIVKHLKRLSGGKIDSSLEFTLKDWESRYTSVSLYRGEVLVLAEDRRYLVETRPLSTLVKKTLAPGIYFLRSDGRHEVAKILEKAGVDIFSQLDAGAGENKAGKYQISSFSSLGKGSALPPVFASVNHSGTGHDSVSAEKGAKSRDKENNNSPTALKRRFSDHLKKMKISDMEREELNARIERKLVLTESQLETSSLKYEKLEARGLDYNGKNVLARQAVASGSIVEVSWAETGKDQRTITGIPSALEKQGEEMILIIRPLGQGEEEKNKGAVSLHPGVAKSGEAGEELRLPLRKISRLRRIKQSIFEG